MVIPYTYGQVRARTHRFQVYSTKICLFSSGMCSVEGNHTPDTGGANLREHACSWFGGRSR